MDTKADVIKVLGDAFDFGTPVLKKQTDATLGQGVQGPQYYGPGLSTRARLVYRTMVHSEDEYGVMTVYLRLNGITPPASERRRGSSWRVKPASTFAAAPLRWTSRACGLR